MTQVCEMAPITSEPPKREMPAYERYMHGEPGVSLEDALTAMLRSAEQTKKSVRSKELADSLPLEARLDKALAPFPTWQWLGQYAMIQGSGWRTDVPLGAMRVNYSVAPHMDDPHHKEAAKVIWQARWDNRAAWGRAANWALRGPRLMFRPVLLVPREDVDEAEKSAQRNILRTLNEDPAPMGLVGLLGAGLAFRHYGGGPPLP